MTMSDLYVIDSKQREECAACGRLRRIYAVHPMRSFKNLAEKDGVIQLPAWELGEECWECVETYCRRCYNELTAGGH
jgi:hypothetical protein